MLRHAGTAGSILVAVLLAYHNAIRVPFVLDDNGSILGNPTLHDLWPPPLNPPTGGGLTVEGRPLLNLSLALNYAWSGAAVWSYHVVNIALHVANAWLLFGILRRTLSSGRFRDSFGSTSHAFGLAVALLWAVHPLQTESVTYVIQRAESLCALFYLTALYAFIRGSEPPADSRRWLGLSIGACLLGMASKEVMVSAPLLVLLYDRTFASGGFRSALRRRPWYYGGLASTWLLLGWLVAGSFGRGGSAGFGIPLPWWAYALTQCKAITLYLRLSLWPHPLVFDYGTEVIRAPGDVAFQALLLAGLLAATLLALRARSAFGFLGAWFFAILAPSSSVVPVATQTIAEHRMYLPLAAVITLVAAAAYRWLGSRAVYATGAAVIAGGLLTVQRNAVYESPRTLWADTVAKRPENTRARNNLALALAESGERAEALEHLEAAVRLEPDAVEFRNNRATVLADVGRFAEALAEIDAVLRMAPQLAEAHDTKGHILARMERWAEAIPWYERALTLKPELVESQVNLGTALLVLGRFDEAEARFRRVLRIAPGEAAARDGLQRVDAARSRN